MVRKKKVDLDDREMLRCAIEDLHQSALESPAGSKEGCYKTMLLLLKQYRIAVPMTVEDLVTAAEENGIALETLFEWVQQRQKLRDALNAEACES